MGAKFRQKISGHQLHGEGVKKSQAQTKNFKQEEKMEP